MSEIDRDALSDLILAGCPARDPSQPEGDLIERTPRELFPLDKEDTMEEPKRLPGGAELLEAIREGRDLLNRLLKRGDGCAPSTRDVDAVRELFAEILAAYGEEIAAGGDPIAELNDDELRRAHEARPTIRQAIRQTIEGAFPADIPDPRDLKLEEHDRRIEELEKAQDHNRDEINRIGRKLHDFQGVVDEAGASRDGDIGKLQADLAGLVPTVVDLRAAVGELGDQNHATRVDLAENKSNVSTVAKRVRELGDDRMLADTAAAGIASRVTNLETAVHETVQSSLDSIDARVTRKANDAATDTRDLEGRISDLEAGAR